MLLFTIFTIVLLQQGVYAPAIIHPAAGGDLLLTGALLEWCWKQPNCMWNYAGYCECYQWGGGGENRL